MFHILQIHELAIVLSSMIQNDVFKLWVTCQRYSNIVYTTLIYHEVNSKMRGIKGITVG